MNQADWNLGYEAAQQDLLEKLEKLITIEKSDDMFWIKTAGVHSALTRDKELARNRVEYMKGKILRYFGFEYQEKW